MNTLGVEEAAVLLHLDVRQVRRLARAGKLPATRVGRRWLFPRSELERILSPTRPAHGVSTSQLSARNQLRGRVTGLELDGLMAEVRLDIGGQHLVSMITRASAERLGLRLGDKVYAVIKSTEIMIATS